jgi:hypothetical protein
LIIGFFHGLEVRLESLEVPKDAKVLGGRMRIDDFQFSSGGPIYP